MQLFNSYLAFRFHQFVLTIAFLMILPAWANGQFNYWITDSRDGEDYITVHIDDKWWMAENLNYGDRIDVILQQGNNDRPEKYCYKDKDDNCSQYGGLYQWDELMQYGNVEFYRGLCPYGWHVSTDNEWKQLEAFLGMPQTGIDSIGERGFKEGGKLKSRSYWASPNLYASDLVGFRALPAGFRDTLGFSMWEDTATYFWNADAFNEYPWCRGLGYHFGKIYRDYQDKRFGASVRCVKDSPYMFGRGSFTDPRDGQQYATVLIENHWWMAENLNIGTRIDHDVTQGDNHSIQKYCYNNNEAYCDTFGGLYQWDEVMQYTQDNIQGICPDGWHVPTDENWMELEYAAGMSEMDLSVSEWRGIPGTFLQQEGGSGFDVFRSGAINVYQSFIDIDTSAYFWTSTEGSDLRGSYMRGFTKGTDSIFRSGYYYKQFAMSVRCVKDNDEIITLVIEGEDTVCDGQEITLAAKTYGGSKEKYFFWWSLPVTLHSFDSVVHVKPTFDTRYFVRVIDGNVYIRDSLPVSLLSAPSFVFIGDTTVCPTDEQVPYLATDNPSYTYTWGETDGNLISSDHNYAIISWGTTPGEKYINVTATDTVTGCSMSKPLHVEVMPSPKPEVILKGESLLICTDSGQVYKWYRDGDDIRDATRQFYYNEDKKSGSYTVEITWENKCRNISDPKNFTEKSTGDPGENELQNVFIRPNPTDGNIILEMISDYTGQVEISITGSDGRIIKKLKLNKYNALYSTGLELGELAEGSYLMAIEYGGTREVHRITIKK